jgi:branched-chain amino acid transport system permease protein
VPEAASVADKPAKPRVRGALPLLLCGAVAIVPELTGSLFHFHIAIMICLSIIATAGLAVIARVGQLSLCHGAFVGLGAYSSVLTVTRLEMPFIAGVIAAVAVSAAVAGLIGIGILRLRGVYFVLITFALNELYRLLMLELPGVSGGANGIADIPAISFGGLALVDKPAVYIVAVICAAIAMGVLALIDRGLIGQRFSAIEENLALAEAAGIPTARMQNLAFMIGSGLAGFAGSLMAHYVGFISPETFQSQLSVSYIIMLVVGGRLALWGPVVGAIFLTPLPEILRGALEYQHVLYGVALIVVLWLLPGGLVSLPARIRGGRV